VTYERFVEDPQETVRAVLEHVGVPGDGVAIPDPPMHRQADELSREWAERFEALA
jgi:LPS sulfotransferase NodH